MQDLLSMKDAVLFLVDCNKELFEDAGNGDVKQILWINTNIWFCKRASLRSFWRVYRAFINLKLSLVLMIVLA